MPGAGATAALVALAVAALRDAWAANGHDARRGALDSLLIAGTASAVVALALAITNQLIEPRTQALAAVLCAGLLSLARSARSRAPGALSIRTGVPAMTTPQPVSVFRHGLRRGWPVALVGLGALVGLWVSYSQVPLYRSSSTILVVPARFPRSVVPTVTTPDLSSRLTYMSQMVLSRTHLERIIQEFDLYRRERAVWPMEEVVEEFRRNVSLNVNPNPDGQSGRTASFTVSYRSTDPRTAMRVTERFASLMVQMNVEEREQDSATATAFLELQQSRSRERLSAAAAALVQARAAGTGTSGMAVVEVDYEVARDSYRRLRETQQDAEAETYLERRQVGEQFRVLEGARLPQRPVPVARWPVTLGALAGLAAAIFAWVISRWLGPSEPRPEPSAQPA
jgi:uncharacterized protein involved in exopolysaccharide biosynthesis